jgi:hypothetical protein
VSHYLGALFGATRGDCNASTDVIDLLAWILRVHSPTLEGAGTLRFLDCSITSGQPFSSRPPLDPSYTSGELSTLATPQILQLIKASTD